MDSAQSGEYPLRALPQRFRRQLPVPRSAYNPYAPSPVQDFNSNQPITVLIDENGNFNKNIETKLNLADDKGLVGVVSIMGVQSSGKSTLLNKCFSTGFKEMNAQNGMSQATKGISVAKLPALVDAGSGSRSILVFDCEGTDGQERNEQGDETFGRKLTVFALASSDVVIVNMKCDNVNLYHSGSIPLIKSVFQVMVKKFITPRCVNLVFVLRDKNEVPMAKLKQQLIGQIRQIWNKMSEGLATPYPALDKYFTVDVVALSHYRLEMEAFNLESTIEDAFCDKSKGELVKKFRVDKTWLQIRKDAKAGKSGSFGKNVSSIIALHLSEFDEETQQFNGSSRDNYRCQLNERLLEIVEETYLSLVEMRQNAVLQKFDEEVAKKIKAGDSNFDPDAFIKEFFESLLDARIKQADWKQTSEPFEELKSLMAHHVQWAFFISNERKTLKKKKKSAWMAAGGVVATTVTYAGLLTTAIVVPGIGTAAAAAAAVSTGALALPTTAVINAIGKCGEYRRKKKEMKQLAKQHEIAGSICDKLSKSYIKGSDQHSTGTHSAATLAPATAPDLIDMGFDDSRAIIPVDEPTVFFSEDGKMEQHEFLETWKSLPDSNEVAKQFPIVMKSVKQTTDRLSASNIFMREVEYQQILSLLKDPVEFRPS